MLYKKIGLFLLAVALLVLALPRDSQNSFQYEVGRPWTYSLLTAPFDIPVPPDSATQRLMRDSVVSTFEPVFTRDLNLEKAMVASFAQRLVAVTDLTPAQRNRLVDKMKDIYNNGIVSVDVYNNIQKQGIGKVRFIYNNEAVTVPTERFLSERMAYAELDTLYKETAFRSALRSVRPDELLQPNILPDSAETQRLLDDKLANAVAYVGVIQQGQRIIDRGDIVTPALDMALKEYTRLSEERGGATAAKRYYPVAGQALFVLVALGVLAAFLIVFRPKYWEDLKSLCFILLLLVGFVFFGTAMAGAMTLGLYMVPLTIVPLMVVIFMDSRTAMFVHIVQILIISAIAAYPMEFIFMQFVAGSAAIDSIKDLSRRGQLIRTAFLVFIGYALSYAAVEVMHAGTFDTLSGRMFGFLGINAVFVSFAYILLFLVERVFGFTSRVTLVELSDINNSLLRKLSEECPGTFQHSMAVSNLATAAASRIGANVQLVRAGALYHDIGKIRNPAFYTENQHGVNPHDALDPMQSARIVIGHVEEGLKMAEKAKLPAVIRDFIREHHGSGKARYFYNTYCNAHPGEEVDPKPFTYPGLNPRSRETSILMMADAVEAASRSMADHSPEAIQALVNKIIDSQVDDGLHADSPLSFRDIKQIKETFISRLRTLYHSRISYPDLRADNANK